MVLRDAKIRIQEALDVFKASSHFPGLAIGTRLMMQVKKGLKEDIRPELRMGMRF